jgi:hypothetical protein
MKIELPFKASTKPRDVDHILDLVPEEKNFGAVEYRDHRIFSESDADAQKTSVWVNYKISGSKQLGAILPLDNGFVQIFQSFF